MFSGTLPVSPSRAMAWSMRVRSWNTIRPAPRFMCPTSELPIWPGGSPTASPQVINRLDGYRSQSSR